jgi:hypothetical protein
MQPPPRIRPVPNWTPLRLLAAPATVAGLAALFLFDPARWPFYPACMFHKLTGLNCPGCGGLRALHQLVHGHLTKALHFNALAVLALPVLLGISARALWLRKTGPVKSRTFFPPAALWLFLAVMVVFGIVRNLPFPLFLELSP